jgi:hypothetical protein
MQSELLGNIQLQYLKLFVLLVEVKARTHVLNNEEITTRITDTGIRTESTEPISISQFLIYWYRVPRRFVPSLSLPLAV